MRDEAEMRISTFSFLEVVMVVVFVLLRLTLTSALLYYSSIILTQHPSRKAKLCTRREIRKRQRAW